MSFEFRSQLYDKKTARIQSFWRRHTILTSLHERFSPNIHSATHSVSKPPSTRLYLSHINIPLPHVHVALVSFPWNFHTPGHTPDEIALYDHGEMMLYVGDSLYEYKPIIFTSDGSIVTWFESIDFLIWLVEAMNSEASDGRKVQMNSGYRSVLQPALEILLAVKAFMKDVVNGKERVKERWRNRDEEIEAYEQSGGQFSLRCPKRLILEIRSKK